MRCEAYIKIRAEILSGKPCFKWTQITVYDVPESMALGMSDDQIITDFSSVTSDQIRAGIAVAAARDRRLTSSATT